MKNKILKLRAEGYSYRKIEKKLNCSRSLICYYCGINQKQKTVERTRKLRKTEKGIIRRKISTYLRIKVRNFKRGKRDRKTNSRINYDAAYKIILQNPVCYLTGRKINLIETKTYQLDHKIPIARNGDNSLKNMGLTCKEANFGKGDLTIEEFINLCVEVCLHNGYNVTKKRGS